jgi:hypothetical protein
MSVGLKNAPAVFSRVVVTMFKEFIHKFIKVYLDEWNVFSLLRDHVEFLRLMFDKCRQHHISLNLMLALGYVRKRILRKKGEV